MPKSTLPIHQTRFIISVMVRDPDSGREVEIEIRKDLTTGMLVGVDTHFSSGGWKDIVDPYTGNARLNIGRG